MKKNSKHIHDSQLGSKPRYTLDLPHPKLMCRIEPDVRPFTWPRRPRRGKPEITLDIGLFDMDLIQFFRDSDALGVDDDI